MGQFLISLWPHPFHSYSTSPSDAHREDHCPSTIHRPLAYGHVTNSNWVDIQFYEYDNKHSSVPVADLATGEGLSAFTSYYAVIIMQIKMAAGG